MTDDDPGAVPTGSQPDVDLSLIRWMLSLAPEERLQVLQGFVDSTSELRHAQSTEV